MRHSSPSIASITLYCALRKTLKTSRFALTSEELPFQLLRFEILTEDREEIQALQ